MFGNVVYARLASGCPDAETRKKLDEELYAPPGGWDAAEQKLTSVIMATAAEQEGAG